MLRFPAFALLVSLAAAQPAMAQSQDILMGDAPPPPRASPELAARAWMIRNAPQHVQDNCWKLGCMIIINETHGYDAIGFYVDAAKTGKKEHWSANQFGEALQPAKATIRFKTGGPDTCNLPVRIVLKQRETGEQIEVEGSSSFCTSPHQDSLVRIKLLEGKVFVRGDDETPLPDTTP
jgi:hypothetical protein